MHDHVTVGVIQYLSQVSGDHPLHFTSHIHKHTVLKNLGLKFYQCLTLFQSWRPQPPPPPLFDDDDDDDDDWLS